MKNILSFILGTISLASGIGQGLPLGTFSKVNSPYDELSPVMSPDGITLYFTMANHEGNMGGKRDEGDIWISVKLGEEWSAPVNAGSVLNDKAYNAVAGISGDGSQLFLLSHYGPLGAAKTQGISVSNKTGTGWSTPKNISIPYFLNKSSIISGHVSSNGNVFVYAGESFSTYGAEDIYVSVKKADGTWSESKNLGRNINTSFQELSPWLSEDMQYLYFASNGRQGYGSFDIYYAQRLDNTWSKWSAPVNMGPVVNSEGRELFYSLFPKEGIALFTGTRNSDGYGDIRGYRPSKKVLEPLMKKAPETPPDTVVKLVELKREKPVPEDESMVLIYGGVLDVGTGQPVAATLNFDSDTTLNTTAKEDGLFSIHVPSVDEYSIKVEAPGYIGSFEKLDIRTFEMKELEMNFKLRPAAVGATVNLKSILFQRSTDNLLDESYDELNMVVDFMKVNPKIEIELAGHTDNRGLSLHNMKLSRARVEKVKEYLVSQGIESKRITGKGYGGIKPIADNEAEDTRRLNRRVEFTIVKIN